MSFLSVGFCFGDVFYWQGGGSWNRFDAPANWSLNADSYSNADSRIPDSTDSLWAFGYTSYTYGYFDLNGGTYTINDFSLGAKDGTRWVYYFLYVSNGTLRVNNPKLPPDMSGHSSSAITHGYDVREGGTVIFPAGYGTQAVGISGVREYWRARNGGRIEVASDVVQCPANNNPLYVNVYSGGTIDVRCGQLYSYGKSGDQLSFEVENGGTLLLRPGSLDADRGGLRATVKSGGTMVWDPQTFSIRNNRTDGSWIENSGTLVAPHGIVWGGSDPWKSTKTFAVTNKAGRLVLGGNFTKTLVEREGLCPMTFVLAGGTLVGSNDVAVCNTAVSTFGAPVSATMTGNATAEVLPDSSLDMCLFTYSSGVTLTKTGAGTLILSDRPANVVVTDGTLKLSNAVNGLSGVTVQSGATIMCPSFGSVVDGLVFNDGATFAVDAVAYPVGCVIAQSSDETLLEKICSSVGRSLPEGVKAVVKNGQATVVDDAGNLFEVEGEADLSSAGWNVGRVPIGEAVKVSGASTVGIVSSSTPMFESITVQGGATLKIADSDLALPPLTLTYPARLLLPDGVSLALTNGLLCVGDENGLPVLEVATNAVCTVPRGTQFKNVEIKLYGEIGVPPLNGSIGSGQGISFGYAAAGEMVYFAMESIGGNINVSGNTGIGSTYGLDFMVAEAASGSLAAGRTVALGDILLKDTTFNVASSANRYIGKRFGGNNPEDSGIRMVLDNTVLPIERMNEFRAGTIICRNGGKLQRISTHPGNATSLVVWRYAKLVFEGEGSGLILPYSDVATPFSFDYWGAGNYWEECHDQLVFRDGAVMAAHKYWGARHSNISFSNGVYQVATLPFTDGNPNPPNGDPRNWMTNAFNEVYQVRIEAGGKLFFQSAHVLGGTEWDRYITLANRAIGGGGDFVMTNGVPGHGFAATVVSGNNNATGTISVAPSADPTTLYFNDGANWAGTVVAGNIALTNLTAAANPATVTFKTLNLQGDFPIRIWKNGNMFANDNVNLTATLTGSGIIKPVLQDGLKLAGGETFELGTCPAAGIDTSDPTAHTMRNWKLLSEATDGGKVKMLLKYQPRGTTITVR